MYKENLSAAMDNLEMFWERENFGRPAIAVTAPLSDKKLMQPKSLEEQWLDVDFRYNACKELCENLYFGGESVPSFFVNFGPGVLAAYMGGGFELAEHTIWFDSVQVIKDYDNLPELKIDKNTLAWEKTIKLTEKFRLDNNIITSITDIGGVCDVAASLRGTETMLYDLYDYPEGVKAVINKVDDLFAEAFDELYATVLNGQQYYSTWMGVASKKPWYPIQCDFSAMISPALFEEFVLPSLIKHTKHLPRSIYHLDGPGEIPHLDMLLDIEDLDGIQWVSGSAQPDVTDSCWFPMYKKIQEKKKNIVLLSANPAGIENLLNNIDSTGLFIMTEAKSKEEADALIKNSEKWSKG